MPTYFSNKWEEKAITSLLFNEIKFQCIKPTPAAIRAIKRGYIDFQNTNDVGAIDDVIELYLLVKKERESMTLDVSNIYPSLYYFFSRAREEAIARNLCSAEPMKKPCRDNICKCPHFSNYIGIQIDREFHRETDTCFIATLAKTTPEHHTTYGIIPNTGETLEYWKKVKQISKNILDDKLKSIAHS